MADKIPALGNFNIDSEVLDIHEWIADSFIDGETGCAATLVYPDADTECDNCILDPTTNCSANVYKTGGPEPFPANTICPRCNGVGRAVSPVTATIRLRVYWERKSWIDIGIPNLNIPDGTVQVIGYMTDLPKLQRANSIILHGELESTRTYQCIRLGEALPYGFRKNRYFIQMLKRAGGG